MPKVWISFLDRQAKISIVITGSDHIAMRIKRICICSEIFIKSFSEAMPLQDSQFFREYVSEVEPGIDLNYEFVCPHCGKPEQRPVPINPRLFYPDAEI